MYIPVIGYYAKLNIFKKKDNYWHLKFTIYVQVPYNFLLLLVPATVWQTILAIYVTPPAYQLLR